MDLPPSGPNIARRVSAPEQPSLDCLVLRLRTGGIHGDSFQGEFSWAAGELLFQNRPVRQVMRKALYRDGGSIDVEVAYTDGSKTTVGVPREETVKMRASTNALLRSL